MDTPFAAALARVACTPNPPPRLPALALAQNCTHFWLHGGGFKQPSPHTYSLVVKEFRNYSYGLGIVGMMGNPGFLVSPPETWIWDPKGWQTLVPAVYFLSFREPGGKTQQRKSTGLAAP